MSKLDQLRAQREAWFAGRKRSPAFTKIADGLREAIAIADGKATPPKVVTPVRQPESNKSNTQSNSFDKKAYQREYMRARRAKKP